ncbi:hypothetical protein AMQ84_16500 [Paenibacillus riograndensis]|uniref:Uncharacterized protein n=1 Tax=Paenibacillus riograndensis TaxID=483937 RepID=A0A132TX57_9BACL|nr:DUF6544 family protein [Paenibacillus riograndensis]KWX75948.1 hypothetical protein AMQ84_16500 [Paenibacillus riograndensis]
MILILVILVGITVSVTIFFHIPYSRTKAEFLRLADNGLSAAAPSNDVFTSEDWKALPSPVRKYFETSGWTGTPKMSSMKAVFKGVDFILSPKKPAIQIDYTQYNFSERPARIALIETSMYGIPFQGLDSYVEGKGSMKGVLAKLFTLFNQQGGEMDQACLVTFLSESLLLPSAAIQSCIAWEPIDDTHARAVIACYGITAGGIFSFNDNGECLSFTTDDRTAIGMDGSKQRVRWSALMKDYKQIDGVRQPTRLQAVWHYDSGDLVYFDSRNFRVEYSYSMTIK